jgi:uncharacterized protein YjbJ (UPF0337 family)
MQNKLEQPKASAICEGLTHGDGPWCAHSPMEQLTRRKPMKPSTNDQIKGNLHELKGKVKEKAGKLTNNPNLAAEGQDENFAGKVQKKVGQIEKVLEK